MKKCKSCQTEIDTKATKCPNCKSDQRNWFARHKVLTVIGVLIALAIIGAATGKQPSTTTANKASATPTPTPTFDLATFYGAVQNGMSKDQVIAAAGGTQPTNCTQSDTQGIGTSEFCDWSKGFNMVDVTFMNNAVASKTKTGF